MLFFSVILANIHISHYRHAAISILLPMLIAASPPLYVLAPYALYTQLFNFLASRRKCSDAIDVAIWNTDLEAKLTQHCASVVVVSHGKLTPQGLPLEGSVHTVGSY